jgi:hypothetical protein
MLGLHKEVVFDHQSYYQLLKKACTEDYLLFDKTYLKL